MCICMYVYLCIYRYIYSNSFLLTQLCYENNLNTHQWKNVKINYGTYLYMNEHVYSH